MTEERTRYLIEPEYKKSACEEQFWKNTLKNDKPVCVKVGNLYRWGSFYIDLNDAEKTELLNKDTVIVNEYENYELIEMWDGGCDFWVEIVDEDDFTEEEQDEINSLLYRWKEPPSDEEEDEDDDENYDEDKMEANGWMETDCEYTLNGPFKLEKVEDDT